MSVCVSACLKTEQKVAQLAQRDRAAEWVSFGLKWKTIFCKHYRSIFNHSDVIGEQSYRIKCKKMQNKGYYAVQGHSRSSRIISIESPYATSKWLILTDILFRTVSEL